MKNSIRDIYLTFNHGAMEFGKLHSALEKALAVDEGVVVEFGTGRGVAGRLMMPMLHGQWYYTVDPYAPYSKGDIDPWESVNQHQRHGDDFYIQGKEATLETLSELADKVGCNFKHMDMTDTAFIRESNEKFKFVYVDSDHSLSHVMKVTNLLVQLDKVVDGGVIVYDDISCYEHDTVDFYLRKNDYACVGRGDFKAVYIRGLDNASGFLI